MGENTLVQHSPKEVKDGGLKDRSVSEHKNAAELSVEITFGDGWNLRVQASEPQSCLDLGVPIEGGVGSGRSAHRAGGSEQFKSLAEGAEKSFGSIGESIKRATEAIQASGFVGGVLSPAALAVAQAVEATRLTPAKKSEVKQWFDTK